MRNGITTSVAAGLSMPDEHLPENLVWASGARNVRDVGVGGEQVVADHEPTKVDRAKGPRRTRAVTARLRA